MVSVATGGGKTVMISQLLHESLDISGRALIIAHTEEIVRQIYSTVHKHYPDSVGIVMGGDDNVEARIIVATRQSLGKRRLTRILDHGMFHVVVIDEAHHATAENTYGVIFGSVFNNNPTTKLVGFTATPTRPDQKGSDEEGDLFDEIVFTWTISDGIDGGFLVPVFEIQIKGNILGSPNWIELTIQAYTTYIYSGNRPCLGFFPSVKMSRSFARALQLRGCPAAHIDGNTPREERQSILSLYKNGVIRIVCNMEVLTEGFDAPNTSAILLARPTQSRTLFTQILGRGLRTAFDKKDCLVVNLVSEYETFTLDDILSGR